MQRLREMLKDNLPHAKPELWNDLPRILRRRASAWLNERLDSAWATRPCIVTTEPDHLLLEVIPGEVIGKTITHFGVFEYAPTLLLRSYLEAADVFVDVGANLGYYAVLAARLVGESGSVYAFEPSPRIRARLERNVALNGFANVVVRSEAAWREGGTVRLVEPADEHNQGLAFVQREPTDTRVGSAVPCVRLDTALDAETDRVALIKVDVEGGESAVFEGALGLLERPNAPALLFESFDIARDARPLQALSYVIYRPALRRGRLHLESNWQAPAYRRWEAPNFFAVKGPRGRRFASEFSSA